MRSWTAVIFLIVRAHGFSATTMIEREGVRLKALSLIDLDQDDTNYRYLLAKARECAYSDAGTVTEAKSYLRKILEFQSSCVSGARVGDNVCDNIQELADTVAHLRYKIENETNAISGPFVKIDLIPLAAFVVLLSSAIQSFGQVDIDAFTFQEWFWALRDGYLDTMIMHSIKYHGLASMTNGYQVVVPFTPEEWTWGFRDGYVGTMLSQSLKNGGFLTSPEMVDYTPFTSEEWLWAVKQGYIFDLWNHFYHHGGL